MFSAFLDTNVLWPSLQRDYLLSLAADGLYRALWSEAVLDELLEREALKRVGRGSTVDDAVAQAEHLIDRMRQSFEDAIVTGWESIAGTFGLPDSDDEHVAAAAVVGGAGVIVTDNLKHFPGERLPQHIEVQSAAEFITSTVSVDSGRAAESLVAMTARYRNPTYTPDEVLAQLAERYNLTDVADMIGPFLTPSDTRD
ncbi:MAG: PIN domain-containing protein [Actinomycetales bacterium]